jgi:carbon-monoxide dehydrogenase medium subunit
MIPGSFDYHRPTKVTEAVALLGKLGSEARVVAGGHSLIPMMKLRLAQPEHLIDLQDIAELKDIREEGSSIVIGAMTTEAQMIAANLIVQKCPILHEAALQIADPQVRNVGTVGGNVANGDPGNDLPAVMMALDAVYVLAGKTSREVKARNFYQGAYVTALKEDEILTAVRIPVPPKGHGSAYLKQKRKIGDYATAAAAVLLTFSGGRCSYAAIGLTNLGDTPLYAAEASAALMDSSLDEAAITAAVKAAEAIMRPAADGRGSVEFRTKVGGVMLRRAVAKARERTT